MIVQLTAAAPVPVVSFDGAGVVEAFLISVLAGALLWAVVPRGAVLVKTSQDPEGTERRPDTWTLTNSSPVPILVESADFTSPGGTNRVGNELTFVDETLGIRHEESGSSWHRVVVPPGESLRAHVPVNHGMTVRYRRAGWLGWLERRRIVVHGYT